VLIGYLVTAILAMVPFVGCVASILYFGIAVASLVFSILGGIEANKGTAYRYPFALRLIS
ncbi:MAG: DUF4870 domain-containing protein, partial [Verrucomicrobiota bacterium]